MEKLLNSEACKAFRPLYIFTVLAFLLGACLWVITHSDLKGEVDTILVTTTGGLIALIGTVVNYEFGAAKPREQLKPPIGTTIDTSTVINTTTTGQETKP